MNDFEDVTESSLANGVKKRERICLIFVLACVWARLATLYMHKPFFGVDENFPYYILTYRLAFTPRAVVGTIWDFLNSSFGIGWKGFCILKFAWVACVYSGFAILVFRLLKRLENRRFSCLFGLLILALPSTFHACNMITAFDIHIIAIMVACVVLFHMKSPFCYCIALSLAGLAVLVHENFIFMYLPFLAGVLIWKHGGNWRSGILRALLLFAVVLGTFGVLLYFRGRLHADVAVLEALNETLKQRAAVYGFKEEQCLVTLELTYWQHVKSVWSHFFLEQFGPYQIAVNLISAILLLPGGMLLYVLWRNAWHQMPAERRGNLLVLLLSCFGASALFLVAHDYIRWFSAMSICNTVALLLLYIDRDNKIEYELKPGEGIRWLCVCLFYMCLDPPGAVCFNVADLLAYPVYKLCM